MTGIRSIDDLGRVRTNYIAPFRGSIDQRLQQENKGIGLSGKKLLRRLFRPIE